MSEQDASTTPAEAPEKKSDAPAETSTPATEPAVTATDLLKLRDALEKERSLRRDAEKAAKEGLSYKARVEEIEQASKSDLEKAVEAARREGELSALTRANARLVAAEARALAAGRFRDASDAIRFLDLSEVKVAEDGVVDAAAIGKQLDDLAKSKPYLLVEEKPALPTPAQAGIGVGGASKLATAPGLPRVRAAIAAAHK